ncbi:addiction module antidote protein [Muricoccus aerilatus]|uniref:addiction module antidote protein n=1 Tax=Muricoccus aerilatus TaxID=452982 RepID=UPI0009FBB3C9|nr:addiction module antidote protein [Roseomonas aerilata]
MTTKTRPWDPAEVLDTPEMQAEYLSLVLADGDPSEVARALGIVARARGMTGVARTAGVSRESLYRALSENGNPELSTLMRVMSGMGLRLAVVPAETVG